MCTFNSHKIAKVVFKKAKSEKNTSINKVGIESRHAQKGELYMKFH